MLKQETHRTTPRVTLADGLRIWAALDVYRWLKACACLYVLGLLFMLGTVLHLIRSRQDSAAVAMGVYFLLACYTPLLLRALWRCAQSRWVLVLVMVGLMSGGCTDTGRWLAHARGITIDPFPGECRTADSLKAGQCIPVAKKGTP